MGKKSAPSRLVRGMAFDQKLRFFIVETTPITQLISEIHEPSPHGLLALSRSATAVSLLSGTLKDRQQVGIQINGDGPLGEIYAVADKEGHVRVTAHHPKAMGSTSDLGSAVGEGRFTIIKTLASGEPYRGSIPLFTGGIGEDLAYYFMYSEQVPTACGLGERIVENEEIKTGGYLVQCLPDTPDEVLHRLEASVLNLPKLQDLLGEADPVQKILNGLFGDDFEILEETETAFSCPCERTRYARSLLTLGKEELTKLKEEEGEITLECHFCAATYHFNQAELSALVSGARSIH